jgi:hypothetical protein
MCLPKGAPYVPPSGCVPWDDFNRTVGSGLGDTSLGNWPYTLVPNLGPHYAASVSGTRGHLESTWPAFGYPSNFDAYAPFAFGGTYPLTYSAKGSFSAPNTADVGWSGAELIYIGLEYQYTQYITSGVCGLGLQINSSDPTHMYFFDSAVGVLGTAYTPAYGSDYILKQELTQAGGNKTVKSKFWLASDPEPGWISTNTQARPEYPPEYIHLQCITIPSSIGTAGAGDQWVEYDWVQVCPACIPTDTFVRANTTFPGGGLGTSSVGYAWSGQGSITGNQAVVGTSGASYDTTDTLTGALPFPLKGTVEAMSYDTVGWGCSANAGAVTITATWDSTTLTLVMTDGTNTVTGTATHGFVGVTPPVLMILEVNASGATATVFGENNNGGATVTVARTSATPGNIATLTSASSWTLRAITTTTTPATFGTLNITGLSSC